MGCLISHNSKKQARILTLCNARGLRHIFTPFMKNARIHTVTGKIYLHITEKLF